MSSNECIYQNTSTLQANENSSLHFVESKGSGSRGQDLRDAGPIVPIVSHEPTYQMPSSVSKNTFFSILVFRNAQDTRFLGVVHAIAHFIRMLSAQSCKSHVVTRSAVNLFRLMRLVCALLLIAFVGKTIGITTNLITATSDPCLLMSFSSLSVLRYYDEVV